MKTKKSAVTGNNLGTNIMSEAIRTTDGYDVDFNEYKKATYHYKKGLLTLKEIQDYHKLEVEYEDTKQKIIDFIGKIYKVTIIPISKIVKKVVTVEKKYCRIERHLRENVPIDVHLTVMKKTLKAMRDYYSKYDFKGVGRARYAEIRKLYEEGLKVI